MPLFSGARKGLAWLLIPPLNLTLQNLLIFSIRNLTWSSKLTHPVKQLSSFHPKLFQTDLDSYTQGANAA